MNYLSRASSCCSSVRIEIIGTSNWNHRSILA